MTPTTKDQTYYDYLEMGEPLVGSSTTPSTRKSWLAAIATTLLLAGASIAYTTESHVARPRFLGASTALQAFEDKPSYSLVAHSTNKQEDLLADQSVTIEGSRVTITFPSGMLRDGVIMIAVVSVAAAYRQNPPVSVTISAPNIRMGQTTFNFNVNVPATLDQRVACRTVTGSVPGATGSIVAVPVNFAYPAEPAAPANTQSVQRELVSSARCNGWGDPHLTTFDGVQFDFMAPGVYRYVESRNFQVQIFQERCPPSRVDAGAPGCYRAVTVAFADSVVRLYLENNKIQVVKASESLRWLEVFRLGGNTEGIRVFTTADESAYVDVTMGVWVENYAYLNIAVAASPYLKDPSLTGLMGNWNGNQADDIRDPGQLVAAHSYPLTDNLFTCNGADCARLLKPASSDDEIALTMRIPAPILRQGYVAVESNTIPIRTYTPVPNKIMAMARDLEAASAPSADITLRALTLCDQVISSIKLCDKYVPNKSFFIYNVCLEDSVVVGDLNVVENTKIAYLRECRRELEAQIEGATGDAVRLSELNADRNALEFGDLAKCPGDCSGRGDCLAAGCHCNNGWTGLTCSIKV